MEPGALIDIWVVEKQLGSGGMGSVYRCHNRQATRILAAIKVLDSSVKRSAGGEERFIREAEILFGLDHPNIVKVRNVRTDTDPAYLEMEFVQGESLDRMLERGPVPIQQAHAMMVQVLDALAYLHARQIRHRDIKPANILIQPDGRVKLVDFGLAMEADASRLTQTGTTFGTVSYAPPEWISPEATDPVKWDIYATGVMFWEMLTGQVAFPMSGQGNVRQQALQVIIAKQRHAALDPGPAFHEPLRALIREMTESNAERRAGSAELLLARCRTLDASLAAPDLYQSLAEFAISASNQSFSEQTWLEDGTRTPEPAPPARKDPAPAATRLEPPTLAPPPQTPLPKHTLPQPSEMPRSRWPWLGLLAGVGALGLVGLVLIAAVLVYARSAPPAPQAVAMVAPSEGPQAPTEMAGTPTEPSPTPIQAADVPASPTPHALVPQLGPAPENLGSATKAPASAPAKAAGSPTKIPTAEAAPVREAPQKTATPATGGRWVTRREFARWMSSRADWSKEAAIEKRAADNRYLSDWVDGAPAPGTESQAMVNVPWSAAAAFCRSRGGLPDLADEPRSWTETDASVPAIEWRVQNNRPAWFDATGRGSPSAKHSESNSMTGFRCKQ